MPARLLRYLLLLLLIASPLSADTFTLVLTGGSWSNNTVWLQNGLPAVRSPGSLAGTVDTVNLVVPFYSVAVDVALAEGVVVQATCPSSTSTCVVDVTTGTLKLAPGVSSIGSDAHLKLSGGTIDNAGALSFQIGAKFDWSSGTLTGSGNTSLAFDATNPALLSLVNGTLDAHTLTVGGKAVYTGTFAVDNGAQVGIPVNGIFDVQTLGAITSNDPINSKITNAGTFVKSAGAGGTNLGLPLDNSGIVKAWFGTLVLSDGNHTNGTFDVAAASGLEIAGTFNGTCTIQGAGTTMIVGTPIVAHGATLNVNGALSMLGGWLQGPVSGSGTANISSTVTFDGGVWQRNLTVNMLTGSILNFTGAAAAFIDNAAVVNNAGALIQVQPGFNAAINNGGNVTNNGTLRLLGDVTVDSDGVNSARIVNNALLEKNAGAGVARIKAKVDNNGGATLSVTSGQLALNGGGTNAGIVSIPAAANQLVFESNTYTLAAGTTVGITDLGWFRVAGGTLTLGAPLALKNVQLSSGVLSGSNLTINNGLKWNGGTILGPGTTNIAGTATADLANLTAFATLDNRTLQNSGAVTYDAGLFGLNLTNGAIWNNGSGASFTITGDGAIGSTAGVNTFNNLAGGTIAKNGGASGTRFDVVLSNAGTISSNSAAGTIIVNNGGSMTAGSLVVSNSANIHFFGGTFTVSGGSMTGSPGVITVLGTGRLKIAANTIATAILSLTNGGTIEVAPAMVFAIDDFFWSGGTLEGGGQARVTVSGLITNAAPTNLSGATLLTVDTALDYDADAINYLTINDTSQLFLQPTATMRLRLDGILAGTGTIANQGTVRKTAGTGTSRIDAPLSSIAGTVGATAGALQLKQSTLNATTLDTGTAKVVFDGTNVLGPGSSVTGTGTVQITSGTLTITPNVTIPILLLDGGALAGGGTVTLNGGKWSGGDMNAGGTTKVASSSTFDIDTTASKFLRRAFVNDGVVRYLSATGNALTFDNATFTNNGTFDIQGGAMVDCASTCSFVNAASATLKKSAGTGNSFFPALQNDGAVLVQAASLKFLGTGTHSGSFDFGSKTLAFAGSNTFGPASSLIGTSGTLQFTNGTHTIQGTVTLTTTAFVVVDSPASVTFDTNASVPHLTLDGFLGGSGDIHLTKSGTWRGGTITGSGAFTLNNTSTFIIAANFAATSLIGRTITNDGIIDYSPTANALSLTNAAIVNNGTFNVNADAPILAGAGTSSISNNGTFRKTVTTGTASIAPAVTNSNFVDILSGTIDFDGGFTQSAGITKLNGGNMGGSLVTLNAGFLLGNGIIAADVTNGATIAPGTSPGAITISGNYTQTASGILDIELGGTTPISQYDQFLVTGSATLDGTLNATLFGGYLPNGGETYDVFTFASRSGDFATKNLATFPAGGSIEANYFPTKLQLAAVVTQTDLAVTQTTSGPALHNDNVTFTVTVTNNGPSTAAGVTLVDTFSGAAFVSATSTVGTCIGTGPVNCNIGGLAPTQSAVVTITLKADTIGTIGNDAAVSASTFDPDNSNDNAATASITVAPKADLAVFITDSPDPATPMQSVFYSITVKNFGPDNAASASIALSLTNGTITGGSGAPFTCTSTTCTSPSLPPGSYLITITAQAPAQGTMTLTATASSTTADVPTTNNTASESTTITSVADVSIAKTGPSSAFAGSTVVYTIAVTNNGPSDATNVVVSDPAPANLTFDANSGACFTAFPCSLGTLLSGQTKVITSQWNVNAQAPGTTITNTATVSATVSDPVPSNNSASTSMSVACNNSVPIDLTPNGTTVPANGTLSWSGTGDAYTVFLGPVGSGCTTEFATTSASSIAYSLEPGRQYEWRVRSARGSCPDKVTSCLTFTTAEQCVPPVAPLARVVAQTTTDKTYAVEWDLVPGATRYEIDEATSPAFTNAQTTLVTGLSKSFKHDVTAPTPFFYRVRALNDCGAEAGAYSLAIRVVVVPLPDEDDDQDINVPAGSMELIVHDVFVPGQPGETLFFNASSDRPWMTVTPASGVITPSGITLRVTADPKMLPNGTFTASIIVTFSETSGGLRANANTKTTIPLSINLVTPVSPVASKDSTSQYAMVIPTVGHLGGINSHWQSDVRVTNAGFVANRYRLTFTPAAGLTSGVQQTIITVDAGATTALDDIIRTWFGIGALGENASGMLEILPLDDPAAAAASTVASSRTYNVTDHGTLGQFIPAIRFNGFIGKALTGALPNLLSIQQIAQSSAYRTNVGIAEGSGAAASVLMRFFNGAGAKLFELPLELAAGEQRQMNAILSQHGFQVDDGRVEVEVLGGNGKVTAYASVVDNLTNDPLLVSGTPLTQTGETKWVLPGVASLDNAVARWRTDMRVFNYGNAAQAATLTFFPTGGTPRSADVMLDAGAVLTLDNIVRNRFGLEVGGGVVHLTTTTPASLVVTGRTYNETPNGTFGQFIPAVTPNEATGLGERTLHILQVEDSVRYRTNVGIAEVSGQPVVIEVQVILPDSIVTPTVHIPLAANEFRQYALLRDFGLGNVYNARVTIRVIEGNGRVTAYGSVIDEQTQDPTYVPAQ
jgi:uncharacterized repeat protein (TIGR01451 family)